MRKRILSILLCCVMLVGLLPTAAYAEETPAGTASDPILISSAQELKAFANRVNHGETTLCAKLTDDIVLNDGTFDADGSWNKSGTPDEWEPIGWHKSDRDHASYSGVFDGNGKTIHGLYVTGKRLHAGLFGRVQNATIKNVTVDGYVSVSGDFSGDEYASVYVGGIVGGAVDTKMEGCTNLCTVKSACTSVETGSYAGGIAGYVTRSSLNPSVTNCRNGGKVILSGDYDTLYVGGIAGASNVPFSGCYNTGAIEAVSAQTDLHSFCAGGVIGSVNPGTEITNCYNTGTVTITGDFTDVSTQGVAFGGVAGGSSGPVKRCYNTGKVICDKGKIGGVVGTNHDAVNDCFFLAGTATDGVGYNNDDATIKNIVEKAKTDFADGTVLALLQNDDTSIWTQTGYLAAAGLTLPLLDWQTADSGHTHALGATLGQCDCGMRMNDGTATNPYQIYTADHLKQFRDLVNSGSNGAHAKLMNDIVLNDGTFDEDGNYTKGASGKDAERWTPIGSISNPYKGTFDGQGHTVRGMYIVRDNPGQQGGIGLFGYLGSGIVKNLAVTGYVAVSGYLPGSAGGIAGDVTSGTIEGCVNLCRVVVGISCAGGIAGMARYSTIKNCVNLGEISADIDNDGHAGGVVGALWYDSTMTNCYNAGRVTNGGGIVGNTDDDKVVNSYYLTGTAEKAAIKGNTDNAAASKSKADFANGTVLALLQDGDTNSPWTKCGYLEAVGMTLPLLNWQTADSHTHSYEWKHTDAEHWKECACGLIETGSTAAHSKEWIQTSTTHTQKCKSCGAIVAAEENHQWENGACKKCGYKPTPTYQPITQKPEITIIGSGKVTLSTNGRTATIAAEEGYELASITLNGKEIANADKLTGLKTGDKVVVTFREKSDESAAEIKAVAVKVGKMQLIARSSRTAKKNIRITVKTDKKTNSLIKEIKDLGYTVKYKYYRSTKKSSKYGAKVEKDASINSYINTAGKKGTRYYYKVRLMVYDAKGSLVAKTELKQCKYAARIWNK